MTTGIIFIAIGEGWIKESSDAAAIVKHFMPDIPITVFADREFSATSVDKVVVGVPDKNPLLTKTKWMGQSPYDATLFLDTDITLCDNIGDIFMLLNRFDLAVPHAPYRLANMGLPGKFPDFLSNNVPDCFPGMNTGMLLFKRSLKVQDLFAKWNEYHERLCALIPGAPQQPAFRTALYHSDLRFAIIPEEYHCRFIFPFKVCGKVKVLHGRHPDIESVALRLNQQPFPRVGEGYFIEVCHEQRRREKENLPATTEPQIPDLPAEKLVSGGIISLL